MNEPQEEKNELLSFKASNSGELATHECHWIRSRCHKTFFGVNYSTLNLQAFWLD